ncbi:DUF2264 domain-containing protein [Qipengyuania atrilutea]|uniref:DUF2264 domain-containing protein n=1 Tax=Qipengyuania atrilutea TaxID=2744473 RepID=A0A850GYM7_9SPHN|nr:DUF2264 domain-containing protein [Actirhodobacter atriluteus]NVD44744.1 DUF2264 domain-containing protein [Actirhodobacter atriluteus]
MGKLTKLTLGLRNSIWLARAFAKRSAFPVEAERWLDGFKDGKCDNASYDGLFRYMVLSWKTYRHANRTGATYPGHLSWSGVECDALEGFARLMPLFGAWCHSGREPVIEVRGEKIDLADEFRKGIVAGTDPASSCYWGDMPGKSNQRIVEAADVALALWLFRDLVWDGLTPAQQNQILDWLCLARGRPGLDNNWQLFFVQIDRVVRAFGREDAIDRPRERYARIKDFHLGDGWFEDAGRVDHYNAWGFHYALRWIDRIDPGWDPEFIRAIQSKFVDQYRYLFGRNGFPVMGRSIPYRMAAPAPLVAGVERYWIEAGQARRALDCVLSHFISQGALAGGMVSQGLTGTDTRFLDPYSGPASSFWSLRSLVMAFHYPEGHPFWTDEPVPLPVEQRDFDLVLEAPRWRITGRAGEVTLHLPANRGNSPGAFQPASRYFKLKSMLGIARRPKNNGPKYDRETYTHHLD